MNKSSLVLLNTLLRSTSQLNIYRNCKDKKKRGRIIGAFIGFGFACAAIMGYCVLMCVGYGKLGLTDSIPATCALSLAALSFFLTLFKTNGYLFNFKEYDMLMSLPFEAKTVAGCKFLYMYVKSLTWYMMVSVAMLIGYAYYAKPQVAVYPVWILLSLFIPIIPMLAAAFIGFLIAKVSAGHRKTNIVQTILMFAFLILCFSLRFIIEKIVKENKAEAIMTDVSKAMDKSVDSYPPAAWFVGAVKDLRLSDMLLLAGITILLFELVFIPVGRSYRQINSKLKSHAAAKRFVMGGQKKRSVVGSVAFKEWRRMAGSANYMANAGFGSVMALLIGLVLLFVDVDKALAVVLKDAPVTKEMLFPAVPFIIYFFIGMVATTAFSPSLEGKNYWIVQSLPIDKKELYNGKMLFQMYLSVPFMVFAIVCISISARMPVITAVLSVLLGVCLCAFSAAWGCVCGIKHMRLDWENELEVIKQGAGVAIYLFPNMFGCMGLIVLVVFLGMKIDHNLILGALIAVITGLAALCYGKVMKLCKK